MALLPESVAALLADPAVSEILVNGPQQIYVERAGRLEPAAAAFADEAELAAAVRGFLAPLGRQLDPAHPYVDARLPDGSRLNAILAPLSLGGTAVTIRKFPAEGLSVDDLVRLGTWTPNVAEFLRLCVQVRKSIVVAGGTGSGKTTFLNVLSGFVPETERIVTIEDSAELRLRQPHVVRLEARPPTADGLGEVTIRDLVRNSLRMRPDRIVVGECRGGEALDMLQAMNTGHDGSLTTVHANTPRDVVTRLETMVLMGSVELPSRAIREQVVGAVDLIVHLGRLPDGTRKVLSVTEVTGLDGDQVAMQEIFRFRRTGGDADGKVQGVLAATGAVPTFYDTLADSGWVLDAAMFDPANRRDIKVERR